MDIVTYEQKSCGDAVTNLFSAIYPEWGAAQCMRMAYAETHPSHALTLLAMEGGLLVGQINIFKVGKSAQLANIGYHVHPDWHRKGVASLLLNAALIKITDRFNDGLVIQTTESNIPSKALAIKAGFTDVTEEIINVYRDSLKFHAYDDGICFYLPCNKTIVYSLF